MTDKVLNALWKVAAGSSGPKKYPYLSGIESIPENLPKTVTGSGLVRPSLSYLPRSHKTDPRQDAEQRAGAEEVERQRILEKAPKTLSAPNATSGSVPPSGSVVNGDAGEPSSKRGPDDYKLPRTSDSERVKDKTMPRPVPDQEGNDQQMPRPNPREELYNKWKELERKRRPVSKLASGLGLGLPVSSPLQSIAKFASAHVLNKLAAEQLPLYTGPGATGPGYDAKKDATRANNSPSIKPQPKKTVDKKSTKSYPDMKTPEAWKYPSEATADTSKLPSNHPDYTSGGPLTEEDADTVNIKYHEAAVRDYYKKYGKLPPYIRPVIKVVPRKK